MSFISDYNKRKQIAAEFTTVLGRDVKANEIRISKTGIEMIFLRSEEESEIAMAYMRNKCPNAIENDPVFEAAVDSMLSTKH